MSVKLRVVLPVEAVFRFPCLGDIFLCCAQLSGFGKPSLFQVEESPSRVLPGVTSDMTFEKNQTLHSIFPHFWFSNVCLDWESAEPT